MHLQGDLQEMMFFFVVKESSRDYVLPGGRIGVVGRSCKREVREGRGTLWLSLSYSRWTAISVSLMSGQPCLEHSGSHRWPVLSVHTAGFGFLRGELLVSQENHWIS